MNRIPAGRPRVIRRVLDYYADGRPRLALDRRDHVRMRRVTAATEKPCHRAGCDRPTEKPCHRAGCDRPIEPGETYVQLVDPTATRMLRVGRWTFQTPDHLHVACVPAPALPLLRLLALDVWH